MPQGESFMPLDLNPASSAEPPSYEVTHAPPRWGEHIVTVVAAALGVLIVATIAVLMGMA
jgi:hypothetical protein